VKRSVLLLSAFAAAALAAAANAASPTGFDLTEAGGAKFPVRAFVIGLPSSRPLTSTDVQVTENGNSVMDINVESASAARNQTFGVVLVVDASESMAGAPLKGAMDAARAFARRRNPNQQLAFLTFNGSTQVVLPFTTSKSAIDGALDRLPKAAYGTHIFDAVARAESMLAAANIDSGSIIVLSDGADTGSKATGAAVTRRARDRHVKLFAIGLHSGRFYPSTLQSLAAGGGREYALAQSTQQLAPLFDELGARLANEYVLRYKSLAGPEARVRVHVAIDGVGGASAAYKTPALAFATPAPYTPSISRRFWGSPIVMLVLALLAAIAVACFVIGLLAPRRSGVPARMSEFVSVPGLQTHGARPATATTARVDGVVPRLEKGTTARLDEVLEIAQIKTTSAGLFAWAIVGTIAAILLLALLTGSMWWAALGLLTPVAVREFVTRKLAHRRKQFGEQLPDTLQVISSALRAGHSLARSLAVVVESSAEPMKSEMQRVVADEQLGIPLEDALMAVAERMANQDLEQVALVAQLQREVGTSSAEVVDRVADTVRERSELRRLVSTLTAQGRLSRWIVSAIPVVLILMLQLVNPHYLHPLTSTLAGKLMLGAATVLVIGGSLVIKRIVNIKV
jgi:tight adherence protein B